MGKQRKARKVIMTPKLRIQYLSIILVIVGGVTLSLFAFVLSRNWDYQKIQRDFEDAAEYRYTALKMEMELDLHAVESLKALYISNQEVTRSTFTGFTKHLLSKHPSIQALEWIPRIPDKQRRLYEEKAKRQGFPSFQITERYHQGVMIRAAKRKEYFPVYFVEPYKGNETALGFDLASNPARKMALESSRDTGAMVASQRITLVQEKANQYGFIVFVPIYRRGVSLNTLEERRDNLQGFALGVFRIGDIVEKSLANIQPEGISYSLYDVPPPLGGGGGGGVNGFFIPIRHSLLTYIAP